VGDAKFDLSMRVTVVDPEHPHHGESGVFTGKVINVAGGKMAEVTLENCRHGTGGCFVSPGQIALERRQERKAH